MSTDEQRSPRHPTQQPQADYRAGRPPFIGRERQLQDLRSAFEAAVAGHGSLSMVVGEPGIGKSALCQQLRGFVGTRGGLVVVGHCDQDGFFRRPYQPFVEVFEQYLNTCDIDGLSATLGSGAADLSRIVPSLGERVGITPRAQTDREEDRWRLLQAASDLLHKAASDHPLLVILEDLHQADGATLDLLKHFARNLQSVRVLVVGTYRDTEVDRVHPLSTMLVELHRATNVGRVNLRGLSIEEIHRLLAGATGQRAPHALVDLLHRRTDGNPLFILEMLRVMMDEGLVEKRNGVLHRVTDEGLTGRIPEGLRAAVGKRLSRLTDNTDRTLSVASVIGREFQVQVLQEVLGQPYAQLEAALAEASSEGIIEEHSVVGAAITYRFSHAFFRRTLYEEIVAPRRIRLHHQVACVLEKLFGRRLEEHAAELAEHWSFASDRADLKKAVYYAELAAGRATEVFAYGDAARQLERGLVIQDLAEPDDRARRCDLLLSLGESLWPAGDTEQVIKRVAPEALALAEALSDRSRASRACQLALDAFVVQDATAAATLPEFVKWAEQARAYADPHSVERINADMALALVRVTQERWHEVRALRLEGLALARQIGDAEALLRSAFWVMDTTTPQRWEKRLRLAKESAGWSRQGVSGRTLGSFLWTYSILLLAIGDRLRAEDAWRELEQTANRTHVVTVRLLVPQRDALVAILDGDLEHSLELSRRYVEYADESGAMIRGRLFSLFMLISPALYLGRADTWLRALDEYNRLAGVPFAQSATGVILRAICFASLGRIEEGRALAAPVLDDVEARAAQDATPIGNLTPLLQAAVVFEHRGAARVLLERLECVADMAMTAWAYPTCPARHLGDAALLLGDPVTARAYYERAVHTAGDIQFRPELALAHLSLAELLLKAGEHSAALEHLNQAIPELRAMKMRPYHDRALTLRARTLRWAQPRGHPPMSDALTSREQEIARLIAEGRSNREISHKLVITEGTVEVHLKHIFGKLGLRSRTQLAAWLGKHNSQE